MEDEELEQALVAGLREALAHARGEISDVRIVRYHTDASGTTERTEMRGDQILSRERLARTGWDAAFTDMAGAGDDALLEADSAPTRWDEEEWEWED